MRKTLIYLTTIILILGCKSNQPLTERQIAKKNSQEVNSDTIAYRELIGNSITIKKVVEGDSLHYFQDIGPDKYAMYPNGQRGIDDHNSKNTKYPMGARLQGIEGIVVAGFVVEKNGKIKDIEIIQSVHPLLDNEVIRVILKMDRWVPGYRNGEPVRVQYYTPYTFRLK